MIGSAHNGYSLDMLQEYVKKIHAMRRVYKMVDKYLYSRRIRRAGMMVTVCSEKRTSLASAGYLSCALFSYMKVPGKDLKRNDMGLKASVPRVPRAPADAKQHTPDGGHARGGLRKWNGVK